MIGGAHLKKWQFYDFAFDDLRQPKGTDAIDAHFLTYLQGSNRSLYDELLIYRAGQKPQSLNDFLISLARVMQQYILDGFDIHRAHQDLSEAVLMLDERASVAKNWLMKVKFAQPKLDRLSVMPSLTEEAFLKQAKVALDGGLGPDEYHIFLAQSIDCMENAAQWGWQHFLVPERRDYDRLIDVQKDQEGALVSKHIEIREGFSHIDKSASFEGIHHQTHYCIYCHKNQGDFCSKGFPVKKREPELGFKFNSLGEHLLGCPLDECISQMQWLRKEGDILAALAMIMRDNPMVAVTGHRICNDCMKACIYQKQDPVDIPQIESQTLKDILYLPWGVEIYELLTWWNPLRQETFRIRPAQSKPVAIMGAGPAGFTLAQQLIIRGYPVTCFDGLTIRSIDMDRFLGPIFDFGSIVQDLAERMPSGFGGVAEYGITARWDKTYLTLVRILLERQPHFELIGSVRFGGTLTVEDIWDLGFSHLALAVGAGLPQALNIENSLAPGMRQASDFLMNLQLTGAHQSSHRVNLDVCMPALIIGGGLTGVDTATEVKAYYIQQVQAFAKGFLQITETQRSHWLKTLNEKEQQVALRWLEDGKRLLECPEQMRSQLIADIAKVSIVYRQLMKNSPAYRKNPEELAFALEEGITYYQELTPKRVMLDQYGHVSALVVDDGENERILAAANVFVATGARPNIAYGYEHVQTFEKEAGYYVRYHYHEGRLIKDESKSNMKSEHIGFLTSYENQGRFVSVVGDAHPVFHGSVVGAIASSMKNAKVIDQILEHAPVQRRRIINRPELVAVEVMGEYVQIQIHSVLHAKNARPGHLYRLSQLNQKSSPWVCALADVKEDVLTFYVEAKLIKDIDQLGDLALMGPSGVRMRIDRSDLLIVTDASGFFDGISIYLASKKEGANVRWYHQGDLSQFSQVVHLHQLEIQAVKIIDWHTFQAERILVLAGFQLVKEAQAHKNQISGTVTASVKGPAQCLLKGICAQCLQWQIDPVSLRRTKAVYGCSWQNEPIELIDVGHLEQRSLQTRVWEKWGAAIDQHLFDFQ
jgi:NADPH-dependent glutamate synthase beta subunit-like oxidoreductase